MGTAGLLRLMIKEYLDMNFVKANYMAYFCLGGACKAALSQISSSVQSTSLENTKYSTLHSCILNWKLTSGGGRTRAAYTCVHIYRYMHI